MNFTFSGPHMSLGIICGRITPARGNLEHRPLSGAVSHLTIFQIRDGLEGGDISKYMPFEKIMERSGGPKEATDV